MARAGRATKTVTPKLKVWVVFAGRVKFGDGRAELLELIAQLGSIKKAVAATGMSYRSAWGYLKELEAAAGFKFLERVPGAGPRSGAKLTKDAEALIPTFGEPDRGWLILAMASTLAGNLTILGSVANLIVVEAAREARVEIGFFAYCRVGIPLTVLTLGVGWLLLIAMPV